MTISSEFRLTTTLLSNYFINNLYQWGTVMVEQSRVVVAVREVPDFNSFIALEHRDPISMG